jgi:hypothetical protein
MRLKWKLVLVYLEIVLILSQDSCSVCAYDNAYDNFVAR